MNALTEVRAEREAQDAKWGEQNHPNGTGGMVLREQAERARKACDRAFASPRDHHPEGTWRHILHEEVAEAFAESDPALLRAELIQVAAVAAAWVEAIDRAQVTP